MKTIRFFFLFSFISGFLLAQSYTNLLDNQNEWQLISCYLNDCFRDAYYTKGDTVVNNKNYKVLDAYHYISRTFLLREEVENKQVFLLKLDGERTNEYLLYDFSFFIA